MYIAKGWIFIYCLSASSDKSPANIWEPSNGDNGIRLNIPSIKFKSMANATKDSAKECGGSSPVLNKIVKQNARIKLVKGPDIPIKIMSFLGFFRLYGFIGTGFAHPIKKGLWLINAMRGSTNVPKTSI